MSEAMSSGQFQVTLPDGYTIERLPVGYAHDAWHLVFIGWPSRPFTREAVRQRHRSPLSDGIDVEAVGGVIEDRSSGGHGTNPEEQHHLRFTARGATTLRISYRSPEGVVATEDLPLTTS